MISHLAYCKNILTGPLFFHSCSPTVCFLLISQNDTTKTSSSTQITAMKGLKMSYMIPPLLTSLSLSDHISCHSLFCQHQWVLRQGVRGGRFWSSPSQAGTFSNIWRHFWFSQLEVWGMYGSLLLVSRDAAKHSTMYSTTPPPHTQQLTGPNVSSTELRNTVLHLQWCPWSSHIKSILRIYKECHTLWPFH